MYAIYICFHIARTIAVTVINALHVTSSSTCQVTNDIRLFGIDVGVAQLLVDVYIMTIIFSLMATPILCPIMWSAYQSQCSIQSHDT